MDFLYNRIEQSKRNNKRNNQIDPRIEFFVTKSTKNHEDFGTSGLLTGPEENFSPLSFSFFPNSSYSWFRIFYLFSMLTLKTRTLPLTLIGVNIQVNVISPNFELAPFCTNLSEFQAKKKAIIIPSYLTETNIYSTANTLC
ncbi:hypothetical protein BpHYR1_017171 [Brachionus plicatilis]|uniref:Uncharacterized protein n=1 Tax=Brachionus plicatilis TaxID=10195 RepID=A0A3M7SAQ1_BRAPC|nr:hypothetical protein BpHYR1_017171 [Brachionus plicatilis]